MLEILYNIIIFPISEIINLLFDFFTDSFEDTYFAIFIVSFFINLICLPMYMRAEKIQEEEKQLQEKMAPEINSIKKNFKGDERFMLLETCFRQHHYHPFMRLRTSLSLLIQIPFFTAAYLYFSNSDILAQTAFINNKTLAQPDGLFWIFGIPINILPILMTVINIISAEIYAHKKPLKDKIQMYSFALFFLILLYNSPSGLVIYWIFNNLFSLIKNIGLKQKNPLDFLNKCCLITVFILVIKAFYAQKVSSYYLEEDYTFICFLLIYALIKITPSSIKEKIRTFFISSNLSDFKIFLLSSSAAALITGALAPVIIISSSMDLISIYGSGIKNTMLGIFTQAIGIYIFFPLVIYYFSKNMLRSILTVLFSSIAIFYAVNLSLYNGELGILSCDFVFKKPDYSLLKIAADLFKTALLVFLVYLCFIKHKKHYVKNILISIIAASCIFISVNILKLYNQLINYNKNSENFTADTDYKPLKISRGGKNVIVIFIDRAIGAYAREIFEDDKELKDKFSGFVLYPNTVSFYMQTVIAYPPMIAGYEYAPHNMEKRINETYEQKTNEAYLVLPEIFLNNGFKSLIVQPHSYFDDGDLSAYKNSGIALFSFSENYEYDIKNYDNRQKTVIGILRGNTKLPKENFVKKSFYFSNYMVQPSFLKRYFYPYFTVNSNIPWDERLLKNYKQLSALSDLTEIENSNQNFFTIFNNDTTHINFYAHGYHKELKYIEHEALYVISKYINFLKNNGIYDNTKIIIVSDHGHFQQESRYLDEVYLKYNPVLMVKDFNASDEFTLNFDFMTNADMPLLAAAGIIKNPVNPYTGKSLAEMADKSEIKILSGNIGPEIQKENKYTARIKGAGWHRVHDDIFKPENWEMH